MVGFNSFHCAARLIAGIETMHMVKKRQLRCPGGLAFQMQTTSTASPSVDYDNLRHQLDSTGSSR
jgi:hypothetical protein